MAALTSPSLWLETCEDDLTARPQLPASTQADVAIVGAGFTGLWTAHHLLRHDPTLRVVVLEREIAGWGASGRNGGWASALFPVPWAKVARRYGVDAAGRFERALQGSVDDLGSWCAEHDVDAHFAKAGTLDVARNAAQLARLRAEHPGQVLSAEQTRDLLAVRGAEGAVFTSYCAAIQPARLVRGLARVVEAQGGSIYERTPALRLESGRVVTPGGVVRADVVVRATEGYTARLPGLRRLLAPVWSLVIATEPLDASTWDAIGWGERFTVTDERHLIVYAQRTDDDRIVFGGRGAPYRFASRTDGAAGHARTYGALEAALRDLLPATRDAKITHRWGGVLGVPRDFMPAVVFDRSQALAWAGGYVGDGVTSSALAGRTLADLVLGRDTDRTHLPWVGHHWRPWEPEPLRWLGVRGMTGLMASADRVEERRGRPARRAALLQRLIG